MGHGGPLQQGSRLQESYPDAGIQPLDLTEAEIDDLVAFMGSLTSAEYQKQGRKELNGNAHCLASAGHSATPHAPSNRNPSGLSLPVTA
jgi:hypothetical protein